MYICFLCDLYQYAPGLIVILMKLGVWRIVLKASEVPWTFDHKILQEGSMHIESK